MPVRGGRRIADILYGMPDFTDRLDSDVAEGKVVLGGCCITDDDPAWKCADCGKKIYMERDG